MMEATKAEDSERPSRRLSETNSISLKNVLIMWAILRKEERRLSVVEDSRH
jgi:hypothetical protein